MRHLLELFGRFRQNRVFEIQDDPVGWGFMLRERVLRKWALSLVMVAGAACSADLGSVPSSGLPAEAQATQKLIRSGGPFRHEKDGTVFFNRESILPSQQRGYYREYTVETPGSQDRGARRIVCGGSIATAPDACYYTADHYSSFKLIVN
jgi:ribonuclease T1